MCVRKKRTRVQGPTLGRPPELAQPPAADAHTVHGPQGQGLDRALVGVQGDQKE